VEGAPHMKAEHLPVFELLGWHRQEAAGRLNWTGHVKMMARNGSRFLSGAISKKHQHA